MLILTPWKRPERPSPVGPKAGCAPALEHGAVTHHGTKTNLLRQHAATRRDLADLCPVRPQAQAQKSKCSRILFYFKHTHLMSAVRGPEGSPWGGESLRGPEESGPVRSVH